MKFILQLKNLEFMITGPKLIAHLRLAVSRNGEPGIKTLEDRMREPFIELIGSWAVAQDKADKIEKIYCYCGDYRYEAPVKEINVVKGIRRAYLNHELATIKQYKKNYGAAIGKTKLGINKFYTDLDENPIDQKV